MMRKRLGELLIEAGLINEDQLHTALAHQRQWGGRVGQILVQLKFVVEDRMVRVLSMQLGIAIADAPPDDLHARVLGEISRELVLQHHVFPLALRRDATGDQLALAMTDPSNAAAIDAVQFTTGKKVIPFLASDTAIESWIRRHYQAERPAPPATSTPGPAGDDDDDIPVVTGAMVVPTTPPTLAPGADPFAAFLQTAPAAPAPTTTIPSARFAAIVPGVATSVAFAGTGLANLDPVVGPAANAWDKHVEHAATQATRATLATATPSFGPAGGFLGGGDDDDDDDTAAPAAPVIDPLVATTKKTTAERRTVDEEVLDLSEPVLDLAEVDLAEPDLAEVDLAEVDLAEPDVGEAGRAPPAVAASPSPAAVPPPSSWGDLLDSSPTPASPPTDAPAWAQPVPPAPSWSPTQLDNPFGRVPITADAFAPAFEQRDDVEAPALVAAPCPRCSNLRVDAARFCPFCGLSFIDTVSTAAAAAAVEVEVDAAGLGSDAAPANPLPAHDIDIALAPAEAVELDLDLDLEPVEAPAVDIDIGLRPIEPTEPAIDLEIDIDAIDEPAVVEPPAIASALVDHTPSSLAAPHADVLGADAAVEIDIGLTPVDELLLDQPPLEFQAVAAGPAVDLDIGLEAIDPGPVVGAAVSGPGALALEWADAAEQMIPRKETDRRNDAWVPPSREIVVTPPPAAPVPEPVVAYTPAAPAGPAPLLAAPWAAFASTTSVAEETDASSSSAAAALDQWVVPPSTASLAFADVDGAGAGAGDDTTANLDDEAIALPSPAFSSAAGKSAVAVTTLTSSLSPTSRAQDGLDVDALPVDVDVLIAGGTAIELLPDDALVALPEPAAEAFEIDINEPSGPMSASPAKAVGEGVDVETLDIELVDLPVERTADSSAPAERSMPSLVTAAPPSTLVGWGDMIDPLPGFQPPAELASISMPTPMPPATLTPPPLALHRPPTLDQIVAPPMLSSPTPSWPTPTPLPERPVSLPDSATPKPARVTATMVMKLDPTEKRRLLELLLSTTELSADALSTPPAPADDGDPDKGL